MGEAHSLPTFLEVIEGKIIAPPTQQINFMRIIEKMRAILEFLTIQISIRMIGVSIQITATTDTPMIQTWVGNKTGHQTALHSRQDQSVDEPPIALSGVATGEWNSNF